MEQQKEFEITRVFNAPLDLVWKAHTEAEHLAKWWGPKGLEMLSAKIDLRPGGIFHYGMQTPDGNKMWGKFVYREIVPKTKLVFVVSFSDEKGGITRHPMAPKWPAETLNTLTLSEKDGKTTLILRGHPINAAEEESNLFYGAFDGMNQGFKGTFDQLEEYLKKIK
jgi:uncharacterized protein YndB with AHSA1/START domain